MLRNDNKIGCLFVGFACLVGLLAIGLLGLGVWGFVELVNWVTAQ